LLFTAGTNAGLVARIIGFTGPDLTVMPAIGSTVLIEIVQAFEADVFTGTFRPGEAIAIGPNTAQGIVLGDTIVGGVKRVTYVLTNVDSPLDPAPGQTVVGNLSGATATIRSMLYDGRFTSEAPSSPGVGGASWRILTWADDWGVIVTNVESPSGGVHGWLDELGDERGVARASGEPDDSYRKRVAQVADVVSPNAIKRALSRTMGALPWCFREVGTPALPGFFFDAEDAYDTDVIVLGGSITSGTFQDNESVVLEVLPGYLILAKGYFGRLDGGVTLTMIRKQGRAPTMVAPNTQVRGLHSGAIFTVGSATVFPSVNDRRFRVWLDYAEFRGFFEVGVPPLSLGEFGFAYDVGPYGAYDATPFNDFYDGFPVGASAIYSRVFQAVDSIREGGVLWDLYQERIGCP
jgi:hypothetical protein